MSELRSLPSVDKFLVSERALVMIERYGRGLTTGAIREVLDDIRSGHTVDKPVPDQDTIADRVSARLQTWAAPTLIPVINATGVIIHTNLGRAPLSIESLQAMSDAGSGYSNLEFTLADGKRGSRYDHASQLINRLTGAEAALVVNNNAAAVLLVLSALAARRRVVISRTQLVEIGGGFRIPDVMKQSGAKLVEIGATNRVHLADYEKALQEQPVRLVFSAHQSNFRIVGFSTEPDRREIAELSHVFEVPYIEDLGSGTLLDTAPFGLTHEPTVQESLAAGVDLVTFSGDKLLGGPQAGIIAGRADLMKKIKKHPLARAVRADKTTYAGLSATLLHYLKGEALEKIPVWRMISQPTDVIRQRAERWQTSLDNRFKTGLIEGTSTIGGGSLPGEVLPTTLLAIVTGSPDRLMSDLRSCSPPIIARTQDGRVLLDPRTVLDFQESILLDHLRTLSSRP